MFKDRIDFERNLLTIIKDVWSNQNSDLDVNLNGLGRGNSISVVPIGAKRVEKINSLAGDFKCNFDFFVVYRYRIDYDFDTQNVTNMMYLDANKFCEEITGMGENYGYKIVYAEQLDHPNLVTSYDQENYVNLRMSMSIKYIFNVNSNLYARKENKNAV